MLAIVTAILVAPVAFLVILLIDANVLRQPIANFVSRKLDRPFAIHGDVHIGLFKHPHVEAAGVVLGNAAWSSDPNMVEIERAKVSIEFLPLFRGRVVLPEIELTKPQVVLERDVDGEANWAFGAQPGQGERSTGSTHMPEIRSLWIEHGRIKFRDPSSRTEIGVALDSDRGQDGGQSIIRFNGQGSLRNEEFRLEGHAGSLLELTEAGEPYDVAVKASAGYTKASFAGTVVPLKLETIDGDVALSGNDLSRLYPLVPVPLPWTSTYRLSGHLKREGDKYSVRGLKGSVGNSNLEGDLAIDLSNQRPHLTADLTSKRLDYKDLLGFLGVPPPPKEKPRPAEQKQQAQQLEATGKVLSSKPYNLDALRRADASVKFKGQSILARNIPLDNITFRLELKDGRLVLAPLDFGVAKGHVVSKVTLDASKDVIQTDVDATVSNLEISELMPQLKGKDKHASAGKLGGRAKLAMKGNSVAHMAGSANGEIALIMGQGRVSTLALVLTNLDLANAVKYLMRGDPNAPVYCAVTSAGVHDGDVVPQIFVIDSSEENIKGEGDIDFKSEEYKLRLAAKSKRASLIALRGPIRIDGTFKNPKVHPEAAPLAARAGAAVALGVLVTPVASLLALVDLGGAKDSNCAALIDRAKENVAAPPPPPPQKAKP
jgi:uncharacterized protein involved in outer membrane biogenesis